MSALAVIGLGAAAGLASAPHCAGMCGPLAAFACSRGAHAGVWRYQLGRALSYAGWGAAAALAGDWLQRSMSATWLAVAMSWLIALALAIAALRLSGIGRSKLVQLRLSNPAVASWWARLVRRLPQRPEFLGIATGFLPCGALAAALLLAASTRAPWLGALCMLSFAAVSGTALVGIGLLAQTFSVLRQPVWRRGLAVAFMVGALVFALRPLPALTEPTAQMPAVCHN